MEKLDIKAIETAARTGLERHRRMYGKTDIEKCIVAAIVAAITEYDKQREK